MDTDKLNSINKRTAVSAAILSLDGVQHEAPHVQVAGVAILFHLMCEGAGLDVSEVLDKAKRITKDDDTFFQREVKALRDYVYMEIRKA